jgi:hypothetical protein
MRRNRPFSGRANNAMREAPERTVSVGLRAVSRITCRDYWLLNRFCGMPAAENR